MESQLQSDQLLAIVSSFVEKLETTFPHHQVRLFPSIAGGWQLQCEYDIGKHTIWYNIWFSQKDICLNGLIFDGLIRATHYQYEDPNVFDGLLERIGRHVDRSDLLAASHSPQ